MSATPPSTDGIASAVAAALGALVADKDTSQVDIVEGGLPEVVRRGRRERLSALVEGPLFEILREAGASSSLLELHLPGHVHLAAGPLADGRVALSLRRQAPTDASLGHLVEEGLLPPGVDGELVASVFMGQGLCLVGPARAARNRVAVAVARAATARLRVAALGADVPAQAIPSPIGDDVVTRARAAVALGADVLFVADLAPAGLLALQQAALPIPVIASSSSSVEGLMAAAPGLARAALGLVGVVGFDPEGRPRLVELHGEVGAAGPAPAPVAATSSASSPVIVAAPALPAASVPFASSPSSPSSPSSSGRRGSAPVVIDAAPGPLVAPPAEWASEDIDDDPGWELGPVGASSSATSSPPQPGSFDAVLQSTSKRPTFAPKAPPPHPQTAALRGTGGLTFEPPGGAGGGTGGPDDGDDGGGP